MASTSRDLDLVLFGATGFTGGLAADYLAEHAPAGVRWAIAGRNRDKLEAVRRRLERVDPAHADLEVIVADVSDPQALADVVGRAKVVATTVGPYLEHGEPLVAACARAGTDYVDITGEPEFVDRMYVSHHLAAVASGARIVHACGFDSIPHDLGVFHAVQQLPDHGAITARGVVRAGAVASGGTFASALGAFSRAKQMQAAFRERLRHESKPAGGRSSRAVTGKPHRDRELGYWLLPLPTIDPQVVARSGAALPAYGTTFRYSHWVGTKTLRYAAGGALGVGAVAVAAQLKPVREALMKRLPAGQGPDEARREKSWFTVDVVAEGSGRRTHTRVSGGDPGYTETAKMLSEAALCLALDDNPPTAGQVTTAVAMGDNLLARLQRAGLRFETVG